MPKKTLFAAQNGTVAHNGVAVPIRAGDPWDADSPIVKAYPSMFVEHDAVRSGDDGAIVPVDDAPVERGTRAPGERRRNVAKKAAAARKSAAPKKGAAKKAQGK